MTGVQTCALPILTTLRTIFFEIIRLIVHIFSLETSDAMSRRRKVETDGISACTWCENRKVAPKEHGAILKRSMHKISEIRNISYEKLQEQMVLNCEKFIGQRFPF